jgi:hypothetical protein
MLCLNKSASRLAASMPAMLQPHFWNFLGNNRILAGAAIVRAKWGAFASDHSKARVEARIAAMRSV